MKRSFGKPVIESFLSRVDLQVVVDTSGAYIPGHGTPTVIMFGRSRPPQSDQITAILGKRGEPKRPEAANKGLVWTAIAIAAWESLSDDSPFITVAAVPRNAFDSHPWSLGGGEAPALAVELARERPVLRERMIAVGAYTITRASDLLELPPREIGRFNLEASVMRPYVIGENVRDWELVPTQAVPIPYDDDFRIVPLAETPFLSRFLWPHRGWLARRFVSGGTRLCDVGAPHHDVPQFPKYKNRNRMSLPFAFVSTHNHFVLDRGGRVFKQSAPVIKLPSTATLDDHLDLLGLLNSSTLGFWMKQVFHSKGEGGGTRVEAGYSAAGSEEWKNHYEYDSTKLQQAPLTTRDREARITLAKALDATARERAAYLPAALLAVGSWSPTSLGADLTAAHDHYLTHTRRMAALQEELDWLTYGSYGLIDPVPTVGPDAIEPLAPGHRPFEIVLARKDDEADDDEKSAWWSRHGHERVTEIPESYSEAHRARLQQRIDLIESDARLALLETPPYKRRWQLADWPAETRKAAESWLLDRLEDLFAPASDTTPRGPLAEPRAYRLEDITVAWERDPRVAAVAGVWTGSGPAVDLTVVAEKLLRANAIPDNPHRLYSEEGLRKLAEWKRVWALQDQEDAWEKAAAEAEARGEARPALRLVDPDDPTLPIDAIPLPPKLDKADFVKGEFFSIRGKLNVPRERFIFFADLSPPRYGWNGWRDRDRALAQANAYTLAENDPLDPAPVPTPADPRRCGVTYGLWESLPDVYRWGTAEDHAELLTLAREACNQQRCPCPTVEAWKSRVLHGQATDEEARKGKGSKAGRKAPIEAEGPTDGKARRAPVVSLAERAWVASLFAAGKDLDAAGVWARHRSRLVEPPQGTLPGIAGSPVQLLVLRVDGPPPAEVTSLDEARLGIVLDDLVASGDLQVGGRGKKKRFLLVPRGFSS